MPKASSVAGPARGRGAHSNASGRYESQTVEAFDDGWTDDDEPRNLTTTLSRENARTIITRNDSPDIGFDQSINPYRGCEHGWPYHPVKTISCRLTVHGDSERANRLDLLPL